MSNTGYCLTIFILVKSQRLLTTASHLLHRISSLVFRAAPTLLHQRLREGERAENARITRVYIAFARVASVFVLLYQ